MNLINKIKIQLTATKVGEDEFGNRYFEEKSEKISAKKKRFIIYHGQVEASKIPATWHRWLHYTTDKIPVNVNCHKYSWQKIHLPNLSGTLYEHSASASINKKGDRKLVSSDFEAWNPNNQSN